MGIALDLPPKQKVIELLDVNDFFLWEYYGEGILGKIQSWIFRSRIKALSNMLRYSQFKYRIILDVGCGPMFVSYALIRNSISEYIGVDIMTSNRLRKYRNVMRNIGVETATAIRASAESLPFRRGVFPILLSLDVLEHLSKPRKAAREIYRVVENGGLAAISLPLENLLQRLFRIGFVLMKFVGNSFFKGKKSIPITRMPEYHYRGDIKSYDDMVKVLNKLFSPLHTTYTPIGFHGSININAVHILQKK